MIYIYIYIYLAEICPELSSNSNFSTMVHHMILSLSIQKHVVFVIKHTTERISKKNFH